MTIEIREASSPAEFRALAALIKEYDAWCRSRYAHDPALIDAAFN